MEASSVERTMHVNLFAQLSEWEKRGFAAIVYGMMRGGFECRQGENDPALRHAGEGARAQAGPAAVS